VPFFIARSDATELSVKIITHRKAEPPNDWLTVDEKSVSLNEHACRSLLAALREHLAVSSHQDNGAYLVVRLSDGSVDTQGADPNALSRALAALMSNAEVRQHLADRELGAEVVESFRTALRFRELRSAVAELRQHLDEGTADERIYQLWCERHSWAFGSAYCVNDAVRELSPGDTIDLLLPVVGSGYRDLIELKRPDMPVLVYDESRANHYFSSQVSRALGQCRRYLDVLQEVAANGLRDHPQIVAYHPRATIVIGRSMDWTTAMYRALHGLNSLLSGITIMTFDQLLLQCERLVQIIEPTADEQSTDDPLPF
jgi:hypothetical protein